MRLLVGVVDEGVGHTGGHKGRLSGADDPPLTPDADGDRVFALAFEWPATYAPLIGSDDEQRRQNELRQIERLRRDFVAGGQADPFMSVERPVSDPPDFMCETTDDEREVGVELTQLTFEERIGEQELFERTKQEVLTKGRGQLAHLRGHAIAVTFFDGGSQIGTGTVNGSGVATFATSTLNVGNRPITATYSGSPSFQGSASNTVNQFVSIASTTTTASGPPGSVTQGQPAALSVSAPTKTCILDAAGVTNRRS